MSKFKKIIICIIALVLIIPLGVYGYVQYKLKDVTTGDTSRWNYKYFTFRY